MARKPTKSDSVSGNDGEAIRRRLGRIVAEHSLSRLAERTGTPISSVHRYVNGGRIPAEFCGALAAELSVSPMWLLNGQGAPYLTDVGGVATVLASGMREVVEAMNAASKLKLGSLAQRRDLKLLRELADASSRHEALRGQLTREVEPVIREWLGALRESLNKFELSRVDDLESALTRLLRFTDDASLLRDFDRCRAQSAYIQGRRAEAVDLQRRNLMLLLADGAELRETELRECFNLCVALSGMGRSEEGRAVAEATLALRGRGKPATLNSLLVQSMLAAFELSLGSASRCVSLLEEIYPKRTQHAAPNIELVQAMSMLRVQGFSVRAVLHEGFWGLPVVIDVLRFVLWREDPDEIAFAVQFMEQRDEKVLHRAHLYGAQARWVLRALNSKAAKPVPASLLDLEARFATDQPLEQLELAVLRAQRARLSSARDAAALVLRAHELLLGLPAGVQADAAVIGLHARNVLDLAPRRPALDSAATAMREVVARSLRNGFGMYRDFAARHGIA
ncbi:MAG: hypothetical protein IT464_16395 [Planctomycetes bacterium]|nr:hypothetical protein [Planctomycetota bacterium]